MKIKIADDMTIEHPVAAPIGVTPVSGEGAVCLSMVEIEDLSVTRSIWKIQGGATVEMVDTAAKKLIDIGYAVEV